MKHIRLDTRNARAKLKPRGGPYWAKIGALWLGCRRAASGDTWVCRLRDGAGYRLITFARADDDQTPANGVDILDFKQAVEKGREIDAKAAEAERIARLGPPITPRRLFDEYVPERENRFDEHQLAGARAGPRTRLAAVLRRNPKFAETPLAAMTVALLADLTIDERTKHDVRAALRRGARTYRDRLPPNIEHIIRDGLAGSPGPARGLREAQVGLADSTVRATVSASWEVDAEFGFDGGLAPLIAVLAAVGCRFQPSGQDDRRRCPDRARPPDDPLLAEGPPRQGDDPCRRAGRA